VNPVPGVWKTRARALEENRQAARRSSPGSLPALRRTLQAIAATSDALGRSRVESLARSMARAISKPRRLAVDRRLLDRVGRLGLLSPEAVAALVTHWEKQTEEATARLTHATDGRRMRRLRRRLARLARKESPRTLDRISAAHRSAAAALSRPLDGKDDGALRRYRRAARRARSLAEDLAALGLPEHPDAARERRLDEALTRWHDMKAFRKRLAKSRSESERRGTVLLAAEIERLLAVLEPALASARSDAVAASRVGGRVVPLRTPVRARARA
jgi:hypothetical protein